MADKQAKVSLTPEEKKQIMVDYKAKKRAAKVAKKEAIAKENAIEKSLTPDQKARIAARTKEIKEAKDRQAALVKEEAKQVKLAERAKIHAMSADDATKYKAEKKATKRANGLAAYQKALTEKNLKLHALTIDLSRRPDFGGKVHRCLHALNMTGFCRFFSNGWLKLKCTNPGLANLLYMVFFFIVFSEGVTVWQYILLTFLPMCFGQGLAQTSFMWPSIVMGTYTDAATHVTKSLIWNILGYDFVYDASGNIIIGGGLGYFIAFEIATFTAQCINFPLQRNITYRSHGNPWFQAMWYFIGWVLISLLCNAINGLWLPFGSIYLPLAVYNILVMIMTGGISMVIFFFIFRIIFPSGAADTSRDEAKKEILAADGVLKA